jgi:phosphohistidine phosphatase
MELILWRHADAENGYPDEARQLTAKGQTQSKRIAGWLDARLPKDALILVSPAARAQQTAKALCRKFTTCAEIGTGADPAAVLDRAHWPLAAHTTLVVGHQPTLGQVASLLLTGAVGDLSVKKGAVWWISGREPGACSLHAVITPGML